MTQETVNVDSITSYIRNGEKVAHELDNRGSVKFNPDGSLDQAITEAYWHYGFYVFEDVINAEELNELMDAGKFDYYELRGREVIFYWRTIEPAARKPVDFTVTATIPGKYTGPASRAYLYYTAEQKQWSEPLKVTIRK